MMMHPSLGLYKAPGEMLYSGALSEAPHNASVDADTAAVAPQQRHQTRGRIFGPLHKSQLAIDLSGTRVGEPLGQANTAHCVRGYAPLVWAHDDNATPFNPSSQARYALPSKTRPACGGVAYLGR